jgi:hypothetical protein
MYVDNYRLNDYGNLMVTVTLRLGENASIAGGLQLTSRGTVSSAGSSTPRMKIPNAC